MNTPSLSNFLSLIIIGIAISTSACSNKDGGKIATQVAAKVGSSEISVHQINQALSRINANGSRPETTQIIIKDILEKLIDQQLIANQAIELKLHRSPEIVSQIEAARMDILVRAYLQNITSETGKSSPQDIRKYYMNNPQLFSQRRLFNIQEIVLPTSTVESSVREQLRALANTDRPIEEMAAFLKNRGLKFTGGSATRAAEQIPLNVLPRLQGLKDGQSVLIESPQTLTLLRVASSQLVPVQESDALPRIEQYLTNQKVSEAMAAKIKLLRANTAIEYVGEFSSAALEKGMAGLK